jgi:signal transduction histidine kinase
VERSPHRPEGRGPAPGDARDARVRALEHELALAEVRLANAEAAATEAGVARELMVLASEELRGPLTSVSGYLQVLLDGEAGELTAGQERMAAIAARNARRLERLVDDLITVAQVHGQPAVRGPVDLPALVGERVRATGPAAEARGVRLGLGVVPCPDVDGDVPSLAQALDHLVEHAVAFTPPGGTVEVVVRPEAGRVLVEVRDEGIPLDPEDVPGLFDGRAMRAGGARAMMASRLGMFLVRLVAQAHGGTAEARAEDGRTLLRLVLPAGGAPPRG